MIDGPFAFLRVTGEAGVRNDGAILDLVRGDGDVGVTAVDGIDAATCRDWLYRIATSLWVWGAEGMAGGSTQTLAYTDAAGTKRQVTITAAVANKWAADLALALWHHAPRSAAAR